MNWSDTVEVFFTSTISNSFAAFSEYVKKTSKSKNELLNNLNYLTRLSAKNVSYTTSSKIKHCQLQNISINKWSIGR